MNVYLLKYEYEYKSMLDYKVIFIAKHNSIPLLLSL